MTSDLLKCFTIFSDSYVCVSGFCATRAPSFCCSCGSSNRQSEPEHIKMNPVFQEKSSSDLTVSISASSIHLSSLSLSDCSDASHCSATGSGSSLRRNKWGSTQSRRAYSDLQSLVPAQQVLPRQKASLPEGGWGYYVDTCE